MLKSDEKGYEDARDLSDAAVALISALRGASRDEERLIIERGLRGCVEPGIYEHFKSAEDDQKLYAVFGVVPDVNGTLPPMVCYAALYAPHAGEMVGRVLYDPSDGFWGPIDRAEYKGPRFKLLYAMKHGDLDVVLGKAERGYFTKSRAKAIESIETAFPHVKK